MINVILAAALPNLPFVCARLELKHFVPKETIFVTIKDIWICHINVESQRDRDGCNLEKQNTINVL